MVTLLDRRRELMHRLPQGIDVDHGTITFQSASNTVYIPTTKKRDVCIVKVIPESDVSNMASYKQVSFVAFAGKFVGEANRGNQGSTSPSWASGKAFHGTSSGTNVSATFNNNNIKLYAKSTGSGSQQFITDLDYEYYAWNLSDWTEETITATDTNSKLVIPTTSKKQGVLVYATTPSATLGAYKPCNAVALDGFYKARANTNYNGSSYDYAQVQLSSTAIVFNDNDITITFTKNKMNGTEFKVFTI